jgi:hypothetical protein
MLTILPRFFSRMIAPARREQRKAPVRFPSMIRCQTASSVSIREALIRFIPTLLTRMSTVPNLVVTSSNSRSTSASWATWACTASRLSPPLRMAFAESRPSGFLPQMATFAPC